MKKDKKENNIVNFPSKLSDGEREVEAILFAAAEPLDIDTIESKLPKKINASKLYEAMKNDKKVLNNKIRLIIPKKIGECFISDKVSKSNILKTLEINRDQ